jgi:hypothetical protein
MKVLKMRHKVFYNYDGKLPRIKGFIDDSWLNDVCPSLLNESKNIKLWVDYKNPDRRECGGLRYTLCEYNENQDYPKQLFTTESLTEMRKYINEKY